MLLIFVSVTPSELVRISRNEVSLERSIFAGIVAYRFINFNWKLNGSREECIYRSIWAVYDPSRPKRDNTDSNMRPFADDTVLFIGSSILQMNSLKLQKDLSRLTNGRANGRWNFINPGVISRFTRPIKDNLQELHTIYKTSATRDVCHAEIFRSWRSSELG